VLEVPGGGEREAERLIRGGLVLWQQNRRSEAIEQFRAAVKAAPTNEHALYRFVAACYATGQCRAARSVALLAPPAARSDRVLKPAVGACAAIGRVDDGLLMLRAGVKQFPADSEIARHAAQMSLYSDRTSPEQIAEAHRHAGRVLTQGLLPAPPPAPRSGGGPLRVGYLSQDFHNRSAAHFIEAVFQHHDPGAVTLIAYNAGGEGDAMTARLRSRAAAWRDIASLSDDAAADLVRSDQVDVLVDLCGLSGYGRLGVLARRPAPVQATYMGYPWSTGVPGIGYRFVDGLTDPPGAEALATEQLVRLPGCFLCYTPPDHAPEVRGAPAIETDVITFGSFNLMVKISPTTIRLWAGALKKTPGSRMLIKSNALDIPEAEEELVNAFGREGISSSRLIVRGPTTTPAEHLATYHEVDIALDSYPYHGTTTTLEAMLMGVPVVTMVGPVHHSRVGLSLLTAVGMPELATSSPEAYAAAAAGLAADMDRLVDLRRGMRERLLKSPLCDGRAFVQRLEQTYRSLSSHVG
jgi:predicted O-linked N-acetylglucosamine transferase (SPINDLY family)